MTANSEGGKLLEELQRVVEEQKRTLQRQSVLISMLREELGSENNDRRRNA